MQRSHLHARAPPHSACSSAPRSRGRGWRWRWRWGAQGACTAECNLKSQTDGEEGSPTSIQLLRCYKPRTGVPQADNGASPGDSTPVVCRTHAVLGANLSSLDAASKASTATRPPGLGTGFARHDGRPGSLASETAGRERKGTSRCDEAGPGTSSRASECCAAAPACRGWEPRRPVLPTELPLLAASTSVPAPRPLTAGDSQTLRIQSQPQKAFTQGLLLSPGVIDFMPVR